MFVNDKERCGTNGGDVEDPDPIPLATSELPASQTLRPRHALHFSLL